MNKKDKLQYAKVIASACFMVGASIGLCFYCAGVFYDPIAQGLNISLGQVSLSTSFMLGFMALTTLAVPRILKMIQLYNVLFAGTILSACSVLGIAFSLNTYFLYFCSCLLGCGTALIGMVPATTMINNWFEKGKSWTTSVVLAGSALSAAIFSPIMSAVITTYGWRLGVVIQAVLIVALMSPSIYWHLPLHPAAAGQVPYGTDDTPTERPKTSYLVLICFALIAILSASLIGLPLHFSSIAASLSLSALTGAVAISWAMIGNLLFKLLGGWLSGRLKPILATGLLDIVVLIATIGLLIATLNNAGSTLFILAFFYGSAFALNELSLPLLVSNRVSRRRFSNIYAILSFLSTLTTAIAISAIGFMYDSLQSYNWIYGIAIGEEVVILLLIWYLVHNERIEDLVSDEGARSMIAKIRSVQQTRKTNKPENQSVDSLKKKVKNNKKEDSIPTSNTQSNSNESASSMPSIPSQKAVNDSTSMSDTNSSGNLDYQTSSTSESSMKQPSISSNSSPDFVSIEEEEILPTKPISPMSGTGVSESYQEKNDEGMDDLLSSYLTGSSSSNSKESNSDNGTLDLSKDPLSSNTDQTDSTKN